MSDLEFGFLKGNERGNWVRLRTIILLRWAAVTGQIVALVVAQQAYNIQIEIGLCLLVVSVGLSFIAALKFWYGKNSIWWKLQRVSGVFLLPMIPAHLLFMHLNPAVGHDAEIIVARMQHGFIKIVTLSLLVAVIFHSGYGVISILKDYIGNKIFKNCMILTTLITMGFFLFTGSRLTFFI